MNLVGAISSRTQSQRIFYVGWNFHIEIKQNLSVLPIFSNPKIERDTIKPMCTKIECNYENVIRTLVWCSNNSCVWGGWANLSLQYFKNLLFECFELISLSLYAVGLSFSDHAYLKLNYFSFFVVQRFWTVPK